MPRPLIGLVLGVLLLGGAALAEEQASLPPAVNLTSGCLEGYDPAIDYFPEKASLGYAQGFTLEYFKHYKVVTVTTPWPGAKEGFRYLLVQCGAPLPEGFAGAQVIQVPVPSIAMLSTTHLPHLEVLGALERLVAVSSYQTVYSAAVHRLIDTGQVAEIGRGSGVNLEAILDLRPALVTAVGHDQPQYNAHALLRDTGIAVAINADYMEPTLLGRGEWLKFTAAFLNREGLAQRHFAALAKRYQAQAALVGDLPAGQRPAVFVGFLHRDIWHTPGGDSYIAHWVADAGGAYLWADDRHRASMPLSFETVFDRAQEAEVWLTTDLDWMNRSDLLAANERYGAFKAFHTGRVYNNNGRLNANKANDFWEAGSAEPDLLLADLIAILHPDRLPDHSLKYFRRLP